MQAVPAMPEWDSAADNGLAKRCAPSYAQRIMSRTPTDTKRELAALITTALNLADAEGWTRVAIHLDQALIALTGHGVTPPGAV